MRIMSYLIGLIRCDLILFHVKEEVWVQVDDVKRWVPDSPMVWPLFVKECITWKCFSFSLARSFNYGQLSWDSRQKEVHVFSFCYWVMDLELPELMWGTVEEGTSIWDSALDWLLLLELWDWINWIICMLIVN